MPTNDEDNNGKVKIQATTGQPKDEKNLTNDNINNEESLKSIADQKHASDEKPNVAYLVWIGVISLVVITSVVILMVLRDISIHSYAINDGLEAEKTFKKASMDENLYSFPEAMNLKEL
jgi:hypothetical protein